jgi:hypothetical protein
MDRRRIVEVVEFLHPQSNQIRLDTANDGVFRAQLFETRSS